MMKRLFLVALAATHFVTCAHAQSDASGPFVTPAGKMAFTRVDRDFVGMLDGQIFDRLAANNLTHFDDVDDANGTLTRTLVQTDSGPVLYDFRQRPPLVQRSSKRMTVRRVFWQRDEVVMQSSEGWFRFKSGVFSRLQSTKLTYH